MIDNPEKLQSEIGVFSRKDALRLCSLWQDYCWNTKIRGSSQEDAIETAIEELCLAWGFTVRDIQETHVHATCRDS